MNIIDIINNYSKVGITGNAGSGKSTLSSKLSSNFNVIHLDEYFIGDGRDRLNLLEFKGKKSISAYIDSCNQFSWWNWNSVEQEMMYKKKVIVEGAILGTPTIVNQLSKIVFIHVPVGIRFQRLLSRDKNKRDFRGIITRFLITEYSENLYYQTILKLYKEKMVFIDQNWNIIPNIDEKLITQKENFIPIKIEI